MFNSTETELNMTRQVKVGNVPIGGGAPISVQSMTNTDTADAPATIEQIKRLFDAGCEIARMTVNNVQAARSVREIVDASPLPIVADIHFDYRLAISSIESGVSAVRINPGNIGDEGRIKTLCDCVKAHGVPVRVGVNAGSLEKELLREYGRPCPEALVKSALGHAEILERHGVGDIVLSLKTSDVADTVRAYRLAASSCDYPLHIGVTEAGTCEMGLVKSAIGIGALLLDGIGDTMRVSLSGDPVMEVKAAIDILNAAGIRRDFVDVISCPTCGRTGIDVEGLATRVRNATRHIKKPLKVAIMGCVVNGPGEAREADVGVAGGAGAGVLFMKGKPNVKIEGDIYAALVKAIEELLGEALANE
ncbi:MAG: flavodoxin-dependent (E)-4-hydroxy-3-methylbut-2-enyl-diphosphate synthase [Clostridia bacterium]|nr:flavodoxin-dependent (E)-4-hydroxy-3-methylbut-2-enyl-diphosphate synthase [Clostridia bacterium]